MAYVIGLDAGGTHTRSMIVAEDGRIASAGDGGPANTNFVSVKSAERAVIDALSEALENSRVPVKKAVVAGPHLPSTTSDLIYRLAGTREILFTDEFEINLAAGLEKTRGWGVVIAAGTGSFCKGRNEHCDEKSTGGWGPLIGDEGSGYDLTRMALTAAVKAFEGRAQKTEMVERIKQHLQVRDLRELKKRLYARSMKRHKLAAMAPLIFAAADNGDSVALNILHEAGQKLAGLAFPVLAELFGADDGFPVFLCGGILRRKSELSHTISAKLKKLRAGANISIPRLPAVAGAVIMALDSVGVPISDGLIDTLYHNVTRHRDSDCGREKK